MPYTIVNINLLCIHIFTVKGEKAQLKDLHNLVSPHYAVAWKEIGNELGVPDGILNALQKDHPDSSEICCDKMLEEWCNLYTSVQWGTVLKALDSLPVVALLKRFSSTSSILQYNDVEMLEAVTTVAERLQETSKENRYKVSPDDWPPNIIKLKHFTSVALIHYKHGHTKREEIEVIAEKQHKGEISNLVKNTKDISEIFASIDTTNEVPRTILIEGAPGIGKTTLSKEIMFQWSTQNLLNHVKLLVVVFLRDTKAQRIRNLRDFVCKYCECTEKSNSIMEEYLNITSGKNIAIMLDGYDELPKDMRKNTENFFVQLIYRECASLRKCMVIITSRLNVSVELHGIVERRVEILGFTEENRKAYIREALKNNSEGAEKLLQYLKRNPAVNAYCYIPLNMTILLCLFNEDGGNAELPATQTEINKKFICITISRFIKTKQKEEHDGISDFSAIPACYKPLFLELCQLAFQALCNDKIVFTRTEIQSACKHLTLNSGNWNGLGLLKAVEFYNINDNETNTSFNFLHLSLQETLAAYHITLLNNAKQINLLNENFLTSRYFNTWIMYVGLTKGQSFAFRHFLSGNPYQIFTMFSSWFSRDVSISNKLIDNKVTCLHLFQSFSEAENDAMCQYVGYLLQDKMIDLSYQMLSPVNIHTLGLFLGRSTTKHWKLLNLSNCYIGDDGIKQLLTFSINSKNTVHIDDLNLSCNNLSPFSASKLVDLFLAWNIKRVVMYSGNNSERSTMASYVINEIVDHIHKMDYSEIWMELSVANKSVLIVCKQEYEVIKEALQEGHYSYVHLFSCELGNTYEELVQMVLILAGKCVEVSFYYCKFSFQHVIDCAIKSNILSFHYFDQNDLPIAAEITQTAELVIKFGDDPLPLHIYNILTKKTLDLFEEAVVQRNCLGTFIFRNCTDKDIENILSCFDFFLHKNKNSSQKARSTTVFPQLLTHFLLNKHCLTSRTLINTVIKCPSLRRFSLCNSALQDHDILQVCKVIETFTSLLYINLSGNNISVQAAEFLSVGINNNVHLQHLELENCSMCEKGLKFICVAVSHRDLLTLNLTGNCISDNVADQVANVITSGNCIENLHLRKCSLKCHGVQVLTTALTDIKSLEVLDLSHNNMSKISVDFAAVDDANGDLENLDLSFCEFQEESMLVLYEANFLNLKALNFSGNHISDSVADHMQAMIINAAGLQYLSLSKCDLQEHGLIAIMKSITCKCSLRHLDISSNKITDEAAKYVATAISRSTELEHLDLSYCELQEIEFALILKAVTNVTKLKHIDLKSNAIGDALATEVSQCILNNKYTLKCLCLSSCALKEDGLQKVADALNHNYLLMDLDISSNFITDKVTAALGLFFKNSQLQRLNLSYCEWQTKSLSELINATMSLRYLKCINFSGYSLDDEAAQYLAGSIDANDTLEELTLAKCVLNPRRIIHIFVYLRKLGTLKYLDLSNNRIADEAVTVLAEAILCNPIQHLNLSQSLQGVSSSIIVTAIDNRKTLQYLDLSNNSIDDEGAIFMTDAIVANKYLHHINLSNNCYNNKSIENILSAMAMITSLQHVDLSSFDITDELADGLEELAVSNSGLHDIVVFKYAISDVKIQTVPASLSILVVRKVLCINNQIIDTDMIELLITKNNSVCHIDIANCAIAVSNQRTIIKSMQKLSELNVLKLNNVMFTAEAEDELESLFAYTPNLQHLEIAGCEFSESFLINFSQVLMVHKTLSTLNISNNTLPEPAVVSISNSLSEIKGFQCIEMAHCELSKKCLLVVFKALSSLCKVTKLNFSGNTHFDHSMEAFTTIMTNNPGLQHVEVAECNLSHTGLSKFAEALKSNKSTELLHLNISGSSISGESANKLFSAIASCIKLNHLILCDCNCDCSFNRLSTLSAITYLNLSNNPITDVHVDDVATLIANNTNLQHLDLSSCGFDSRGTLKIVDVLKTFTTLVYLNLASNQLSDSAEVLAFNIATLITSNITIQHLYLPHCLFQENQLKVIFQAMKGITSLIYVDISCNQVSDLLCQDVAAVISTNDHMKIFRLQKLRLSQIGLDSVLVSAILPKIRMVNYVSLHQCLISDQQLDKFSEMFSNNESISNLILHDCLFSDVDNGTSRFLQSLKHTKFLKQLSLTGLVLLNNDIQSLQSLIASNQDIQELSLDNCKISKCSNNALFSILACITNLQRFSINNMIISKQIGIVDIFKKSKLLQHLSFLHCKLQIRNILLVCEAITNITSLLCINLSGNNITNQAAEFLSVGIGNNIYLQQLELANCNFSEESLQTICSAIRKRNLLTLNLNCNCITDQVAGNLAHVIISRNCLENLHLKKCSLKYYGIQILAKALTKIKSLKLLDLSHNKMTNASLDLATVMNANSDLEHLDLSNCELQERALMEVSSANLLKLKVLNFSGNQISDSVAHQMQVMIRNAIGLQHLILSNCSLQKRGIIEVMECTKCSLRHLDISLNVITEEAAKHVTQAIARSTELEHLDLSYCGLKDEGLVENVNDSGFLLIMEAAKNLTKLKHINLEGNVVNDIFLSAELEAVIENNVLLNSVCLSNCDIIEEGMLIVADAFKSSKLLSHLDFSSNLITNMVVSRLTKTDIFSKASQFKSLNVSRCRWQTNGLLNILLATMNVSHLNSIDCSGCVIDNEVAQQLAKTITENNTLERLILGECTLQPLGLGTILDTLKKLNVLNHLDLTSSTFTDKDATKLAEVLSCNQINHLNVSQCLQGVNSLDVLTAIASSVALQYLDLSYDDISDDEASLVASAITANKYLHHVSLTNNEFGTKSIKVILCAMATLNSLKHVNLDSYCITDESAVDLEAVAKSNALENVVVLKYAICNVKLENVPNSIASLVIKTALCINDQTVNCYEAQKLAALISRSRSINHIDFAKCVIPASNKTLIVKAIQKLAKLNYLNLTSITFTAKADKELACVFTHCSKLQHLEISGCELRDPCLLALSEAMKEYKQLLHLNVNSNTLTEEGIASICDGMSEIKQFECLEIADCCLSETGFLNVLVALSKLHNLAKFNVSCNVLSDIVITRFTTILSNNPSLQHIEMAQCKLNSFGVIKVTEALQSSKLMELSYLDLSSNNIASEAANELFSVIAGCNKLKYLGLGNCKMTHLSLFNTLSALTTLTYLDLSNNMITNAHADVVADVIAVNNNLQHLNLFHCDIKSEGTVKILTILILKQFTTLRYLNLGLNLAPDNSEIVASSMAALITNNNSLKSFHLPYCLFPEKCLKIIFHAISNVNSLICIDISCNQVTDALCQEVLDMVASNPGLKEFRLCKLILSHYGFEQLSGILPKFRTLQHVSLHQCHVSEKQMMEICEMFSNNECISYLSVVDCVFSYKNKAVSKVFKSLKYTKCLKHLILKSVILSDSCIDYILGMIEVNQSIEHFCLDDCRMSGSTKVSLFKELKGINTLHHFNISNMTIGDIRGISDSLKSNTSLRYLNLSNCKLQNDNAWLVCNAVLAVTTLAHINLSGNNISKSSAEILSVGISRNSFLRHLELDNCNLCEEGLRSICRALHNGHLLTLSLSCNCISDKVVGGLATVFSNNHNIEHLYIKKCSMEYNGIKALIVALAKVKSLKTIDLSHNKMLCRDIDVAAVVIANNSLERLNLSYCQLQECTVNDIVSKVNAVNLVALDLCGNQISDSVANQMQAMISNAVGLQHLSLSNCSFQGKRIAEVVQQINSSLRYLDISSNASTDEAAKSVAKVIARSDELEHLDLSYCELREMGLALILEAVKSTANLKYINLQSNTINSESCATIGALATNNYVLNYLCLSNCGLMEEGLLRIVDGLRGRELLSHLDISSNFITNNVIDELKKSDVFSIKSLLKHVNISHCQWQKDGFSKMLMALTKVCSLKHINCTGCNMDDVAAEYLACSISANNSLEELVLSNCEMNSGQLVTIFNALTNINTLKHLNLSNNRITNEIIVKVVEILSGSQLEHLNLSHCLKGVNSSDILTAIANSATLQYLDLSYNDISDNEASCVASAVTANQYLCYVNLTNNHFCSGSIQRILNAMTNTNSLKHVELNFENT